MNYDIAEELVFLYDRLKHESKYFLLEEVVDKYKEYPASQVHGWGRVGEGEVARVYGKIRDLLHIRVLERVEAGTLDKGIASKHLSAFFDYVERKGVDVTSKGDKVESVIFYLPSNGRDEANKGGKE